MANQALAAPRVASIDMCADQYVLGMVPRAQILAVSDRARLPASYYGDRADGLRVIKPKLESLLALHPDIVVRTWGGDAKLINRLAHYGIKVITINEISDYAQARDELIRAGHVLGEDASAEIEAHSFDKALQDIRPIGAGKTALYYTPSGVSAGPDTMVGHMLQTLGYRLETHDKGFFFLSPEVLLSLKPDVFALGFYDDRFDMRHTPGRNALVRTAIAARPNLILPARAIACSGWFSVYDLQDLKPEIPK